LYGRSYASGHFVASFNYRRWPTKAALVLAMFHERMAVHPETAAGMTAPAILRELYQRHVSPRRSALVADLERGKAAGESHAGTDAELLIDAIFGAIYYRLLLRPARLERVPFVVPCVIFRLLRLVQRLLTKSACRTGAGIQLAHPYTGNDSPNIGLPLLERPGPGEASMSRASAGETG
jgi:hypothetical protein